mmetsp:Transcript_29244/g.71886  ORF Transcript_29244/g.71886 Transcript_29244/m.71886 type:complete len:160 (-) Transcript_29244:236-715(-)
MQGALAGDERQQAAGEDDGALTGTKVVDIDARTAHGARDETVDLDELRADHAHVGIRPHGRRIVREDQWAGVQPVRQAFVASCSSRVRSNVPRRSSSTARPMRCTKVGMWSNSSSRRSAAPRALSEHTSLASASASLALAAARLARAVNSCDWCKASMA